jgi:hypothetical protein
MPRRVKGTTDAEVIHRATVNWAMTSDSSPEGVGSWDIKTAPLAEAILKILASGCAVMFGTTFDGTAVSATIFQDDKKVRHYLTDSTEMDDWADRVLATARKATMPRVLPATGD